MMYSHPNSEAFASSIRDLALRRAIPVVHTRFWRSGFTTIGPLRVQCAVAGAPCIYEGVAPKHGWTVFIPLQLYENFTWNGLPFSKSSIAVVPPGSLFWLAARSSHEWGAFVIPAMEPGDRAAFSRFLGFDAVCEIDPQLMLVFRRLLFGMAKIGSNEFEPFSLPEDLPDPSDLVLLLMEALATATPAGRDRDFQTGRPLIPRDHILVAALGALEATGCAATVEELASAAGVSPRTLRAVFHEFFGVGPNTYARLRRLCSIRKQLRRADRPGDTVTSVAMQCGVADLGRLARDYRKRFGESPSTTIKHARTTQHAR